MISFVNDNNINMCYCALSPIGAVRNVPMRDHTSFKIGGCADILLCPRSVDDLLFALNTAKELEVPVFVMGNGSNLLISDFGIRGLVIKLRTQLPKYAFDMENMLMTVSADTLFSTAVKKAIETGFMGLEWGAGIPGTVGGAVSMNAGAYGGEIKNVIRSVQVIRYSNGTYEKCDIPIVDTDFGYRYSRYTYPSFIIIGATFKLMPDDGKTNERMNEFTFMRTSKQPLKYPSAGSVFKRPEGYYAGKLIEDAGLKGFSYGGAQVSELHAGFIINTGNATADDVINLIKIIKDRVYKQSGVLLEEELKITGG